MSEFFASLTEVSGWRKDFFNARISRLPDKEMLSFDATEIAAEAAEISYAQYGMGKEGGYQRQLGLILLVGHESHMPVLFRVLPGNITDVTTVQDMLFRFDEITDSRRVFGAVVDRGYFSLANLARFVDAGSRVLLRPRLIQSGFRMPLKPLWNTSGVMPPVFQANIAGAGRFPSTPVLKTGAIVNSGFMFIAVTRNLTLKIQPSTTNWNRFRKSGFGGGRTTRVTARKRVLFSRAGG